jgi:trk system potassium uptake protein TrkA
MEGDPPLIAAIIRHETLIVPDGNDRLEKNDLIYFISKNDAHLKTLALLNKHARKIERVMITGGGRTGLRLAKTLENEGLAVKIIESNPDRALVLAELLNSSVVLNGDGSDQSLLMEENIEQMDAMVALTGDEETNIIVAMLAKRFGVLQNIVQINKFNYLPLMSAIGIDQVVSPRLSAVNSILHHIRRGKVLSAISLQNEAAEVLEAEALETSDIVGQPLKKVKIPKGALLIGILHNGEAIIPGGDSVVHSGDHVVIFARKKVVPKVEKLLTVKLNYI